MNEKIQKIIDIEWEMFQQVDNIGGRADCQDDKETFYIMRRSQYENWSQEMIGIYFDYLSRCAADGRNLVTEKYARMMAYTDPQYYDKYLRDHLPAVPLSNYPLIGRIVDQMMTWEEALAARYPHLAGSSRPIRSDQDKYGFTSMETYARGELETYPHELLLAYLRHIDVLLARGQSMSENILSTMTGLYGYDSIEEAEKAN